MKKIIIFLFIVLFSFNVKAANFAKLIDLFGEIFDSYPVKQVLYRIDRFFRYDGGYNNFIDQNKELIKLNFEDYISEKNMEYNQDLQQLTTHKFNNFDINNKQQDSLNLIKRYLKLKNYKYLQENKTFLICRDSKEYFSFFIYFNKNFITMNKAITRHRFSIDNFLSHEMVVGAPWEDNRVIILPSIKSKADKSFANWYYFYLNDDKLYFDFVKGNRGVGTAPNKISFTDLEKNNYCLINSL